MVELDEAAVLTRAKAIAAKDGFMWQLDFDAPLAGFGACIF